MASNDLRCNVGGASGSGTETVSIAAGSSVSFTADTQVPYSTVSNLKGLQHEVLFITKVHCLSTWRKLQPPLQHSMVLEVSGSRSWTSALSSLGALGISNASSPFPSTTNTHSLQAETYTFNVPSCIPAGEYLIRIQQLAIHNPGGVPQFYIGCAQVAITGGGSKDLGPKVAIPGAFKASDPGYTANIYNNFNSYTVPGPAVAKC